MKRLALTALAIAAVPAAFAQIVTSYSGGGTITAATDSTQYIYSRIGGPRGSHGYAWVPFLKQATQSQKAIPFPGTSDVATSIGSFFPFRYWAAGMGRNTFTNSDTAADFTATLSIVTMIGTGLGPHSLASVSALYSDSFSFTVTQGVVVRLSVQDTLGVTVNLTGSGSIDNTGGGPGYQLYSLDPGSYTLSIRGGSEGMDNTQTGASFGTGLIRDIATVDLQITPGG